MVVRSFCARPGLRLFGLLGSGVPEPQSGNWHLTPVAVKFVVQGEEFEEETAEEPGRSDRIRNRHAIPIRRHARSSEADQRVRANIQKLVEFTIRLKKNSGATGRVLWSEAEDNLAQK